MTIPATSQVEQPATDSYENESDQNSIIRSARFENEAGPCKNQEGRPNGSPRTKNSKYLGMYNTGRPSNFRLGLRSPNVERNNIFIILSVIELCTVQLVVRVFTMWQ